MAIGKYIDDSGLQDLCYGPSYIENKEFENLKNNYDNIQKEYENIQIKYKTLQKEYEDMKQKYEIKFNENENQIKLYSELIIKYSEIFKLNI